MRSLLPKPTSGLSSNPTRRGTLTGRTHGVVRVVARATTTGGAAAAVAAMKGMANMKSLSPLLVDSSTDADAVSSIRDVKAISYVSRRRLDDASFDPDEVDEEGLPLIYNEARIAQFWSDRPGELLGRWTRFTAISAPWLTSMANAFLTGKIRERQVDLAREAVNNLERLGPTFIKLGQIMSIRPDVLPPPIMAELAKLQDRIEPFSTPDARLIIEKDLGAPIDTIFSEFSEKPIAAASLAQVYRARLRSSGEEVAVKVQRPNALSTVSKDLYVLRRGVGLYESLVKRFTAQTTDYQLLVSTFAEGLYTELDFRNEALNGQRMRELLDASEFRAVDITIPKPYLDLTTRRVLTMQWIDGVKLTTLPPAEIRELVKVGQAAFLTQLLEIGFIHGDPHPGNLLKVTSGPDAGKLALLDFGLVAEIPQGDRKAMISATIHLANRDWPALVDDFVALEFLPQTCDRAVIVPVMERVLGPYLRGGGARAFNFQALSQDLLAVTLEIPFSVPPYMSLLARSVATLEGIALAGDPDYQMVAQAYPFVARKLLRNEDNSDDLLRDILYDADGKVKPARMSALLNAALGKVASRTDGFIDFDAVPEDGADAAEVLTFLVSPEAKDLRPLLASQLASGLDLVLRDRFRKLVTVTLPVLLAPPRIPILSSFFPAPPPPPLPPVLVPGLGFISATEALDLLAPPLSNEEVVYLNSLLELAASLTGLEAADLAEGGMSPQRLIQLISSPTEQIKELSKALSDTLSKAAATKKVPATATTSRPNSLAPTPTGSAASSMEEEETSAAAAAAAAAADASSSSSFSPTVTMTSSMEEGSDSSSADPKHKVSAPASHSSHSSHSSPREAIAEVVALVVDELAEVQSQRAGGIPAATLFPLLPGFRRALARNTPPAVAAAAKRS